MNLLKRQPLLLFFVCFGFAMLCYWQLAIHPMKHDATNNFLQIHYFLSDCLRAGVWPLWMPFMGLGLPFHADMQTSVHYFPSWIIAAVTDYNIYVFHFEFLFHLAIGGLGMFFFIRFFSLKWKIAVAAAIFYTLSGHFLSNAQHQSWVVSTAYLPWVWAFLMRFFHKPNFFHALGLALFNSLMLTGGYPIFLLLNAYAILFYLIFNFPRKEWSSFLIWGTVALGIFFTTSAGYFYSTWDVWDALLRSDGMTYEAATKNPYSPQSLLGLLNPHILVQSDAFFDSDSTMTNIYQGLFFSLLLILSFFTKKSRAEKTFTGIGILFLLLAFGDYCILRAWTFHFPFMDLFRHMGIFRIFTIIFFYPVISSTLEKLATNKPLQLIFKKILLFSGGLYALYIGLGFIWGKIFLSWNVILGSTFIQLIFIVLAHLFIVYKKQNYAIVDGLILLNLLNLLLIHQFNIPTNVTHPSSLVKFNTLIDDAPSGFQASLYKNETMAAMNNFGREKTIPIYYNWSVFSKKFAHDQYYPFVLKKKAALEKQSNYWEILDKPLLHAPQKPMLISSLIEYQPNYYKFKIDSPVKDTVNLRFMQTNFKHWKAYLNGNRIDFDLNTSLVELKGTVLHKGENELVFRYYSKKIVWTMALGLSSSLLAGLLLLLLYFQRKRVKK